MDRTRTDEPGGGQPQVARVQLEAALQALYADAVDEPLIEANRLLHEQLDTARETIGKLRAAQPSKAQAPTVYPQGVMGIPPYSPPGPGSMTVEPGLSWNGIAPSQAQEAEAVVDWRVVPLHTARPASPVAQAQAEEAVATLHDDGHYTWNPKVDKPNGYNYVGWRMEVYARAPASPVASNEREGLTDEQREAITTALSLIGLSGDPRVRNVHKVLHALLAARTGEGHE